MLQPVKAAFVYGWKQNKDCDGFFWPYLFCFNLQKETSRKTCEMLRLNLQNDD